MLRDIGVTFHEIVSKFDQNRKRIYQATRGSHETTIGFHEH